MAILTQFGPKKVQIWVRCGPNYIFGNILTNQGNFELKLGHYLYFHGSNHKIERFFQAWLFLLQSLGQRRFKYGSHVGQNYLFRNILNIDGNFELKRGHYLYFYGMHQKIKTFFQICLKHALYTIHGMLFLLVPWLTGGPINLVLSVSHLVTELVIYS